MKLYSVSLTAFSFGVLLIGVLALVKRKDRVAVLFSIFTFCVVGWGLPAALWFTETYSLQTTERLMRIAHLFSVYIPIVWFVFVFEFIERKEPCPHFYKACYFFSFCLMLSDLTSLFLRAPRSLGGWRYAVNPGPLYHLFTAYFFVMVPYCFYHLFSVYQKASGQYKAQLGCFVLATIFGFVGGGSTFLLVYKISFGIELIYLMPFYPIFMGIGLVQHGLFDVQKIVNSFHREKLAAIGTLAASVNHEIKSPLYVIQGVSQSFLVGWQEGGCREPEKSIQCAVEALKKVMAQSSRALDIIRKFSNFAKRDVSEAPQLSAVSLKMTYENVLPLVQHELALDKINIESRIPENLPQARVDERHLEEILFNLIVNACHALKLKGGGNIVISGGQGEGKLGLTIEDNGPGISKENLNKIFEPFYTTKSEGTGLGLYITKQLVERNGGNISVVSRPGMGTIFQLRFKL